MGVKLGNEVGYSIRFEDCTSGKCPCVSIGQWNSGIVVPVKELCFLVVLACHYLVLDGFD